MRFFLAFLLYFGPTQLPPTLGVTCPAGQGGTEDSVCSCDADGIVAGIDTGHPGCRPHPVTNANLCYMSLACTGQGSTSFAFGGQIKYRFCNPSTDNELICGDCEPGLFSQSDEETCLPCPPGSYSAATAATSCANSCPTNTPYSQAASTSASQCSTPVCARNSYWGGPSTGLTCDNCPPYAPLAPPGSSDITDCFHVFASLFVVCSPNNRLIAYNSDEQQFQTLVE